MYNLHLWVDLTGIGTCLFHATLRYNMQLLDELPMNALVISASCWLLRQKHGFLPYKIAGPIYLTFIILMFYSEDNREGDLHQTCRMLMLLTFVGCFIHIFSSCLSMAKQDDKILKQNYLKFGGQRTSFLPTELFTPTFYIWVAAIVCWIVDVGLCEVVQNIPFIPYL